MKKRNGALAAKAQKRSRKGPAKRKTPGRATVAAVRSRSEPNRRKETASSLRRELAAALKRIAELEAAVDTDFLLDVPNRRGFERALNRAIAYMNRYHTSGALIVLDLDRLKPVNDTFGHSAGDQVLKAIATTLVRHVRASDVVGRLGGDEFALLLWNLTESDAKAKAAALEQAIDGLSFAFDGRRVTVGASAGVAVLGPQAEASRVMEAADAAMYVRKAQRRHEQPASTEAPVQTAAK